MKRCGQTNNDVWSRRQILRHAGGGAGLLALDDFKLWKKDERFAFMKEKKDGYTAIFKVPDGKEVRYNKAKVPILRAADESDEE